MIYVIHIQLWRVLVPFFPICVRVVTTFYAEIDIRESWDFFTWETNFP